MNKSHITRKQRRRLNTLRRRAYVKMINGVHTSAKPDVDMYFNNVYSDGNLRRA